MSTFPCPVRHDFRGHLAVITGASRGIGEAIAAALVAAGASVYDFDIDEPDHASFEYRRVDTSDAAAVDAAVKALPRTPTLLVNNAGITRDRTLAKMSDLEWSSVLSVNLTGAFHMIRAIAPGMAAQAFGRIVNVTSINGLRGKFGQANYAAAKAGLIGLTKTAAKEFGRFGVTVNAVAPGMVMTAMARAQPAEVAAQAAKEAVLPSLAEPADISEAVLYLLSDGARAITGEVLRVDAGQYI
jgi:3-oxoacyl-[acyl-carrier protein] reductase